MTIKTMSEIFYHPSIAMKHIRDEKLKDSNEALITLALLALIPPASLLIGTTQIGWSLSLSGEAVRLSFASAALSAMAFYIALCISLLIMGFAIHWMERTYGGEASLERCMNLTLYTATPLLVAGLAGLYPTLWLCVAAGMAGLIYSTYLLFTGVPVIMRIPEERGFMFCMAILTVGLVILVTLRALTVFMWNSVIPLTYLS